MSKKRIFPKKRSHHKEKEFIQGKCFECLVYVESKKLCLLHKGIREPFSSCYRYTKKKDIPERGYQLLIADINLKEATKKRVFAERRTLFLVRVPLGSFSRLFTITEDEDIPLDGKIESTMSFKGNKVVEEFSLSPVSVLTNLKS